MAAITFKAFRGSVPRAGERLQQPRFAKSALNIKITSGYIEPLRGMALSATTLASSIKSFWRYRHVANGSTFDNWLTFDADADVVGSLNANDSYGRMFWTSENHGPRMSTYAAAISGGGPYPASCFTLGVPSQLIKPSLLITGGVGATVSRAYVSTLVTALGEESGPSPASDTSSGKIDATWSVHDMQGKPTNSGSAVTVTSLGSGEYKCRINESQGMEVGTRLVVTYNATGYPQPIVETVVLTKVAAFSGVTLADIWFNRGSDYPAGASPTLTWVRDTPINTTGMTRRIYRTEGTAGAFQLVAEVDAAVTTYNDTLTTIPGDLLATAATLPAPLNLKALVSLPNGCLCGLTENEVCFSDPYMPYSWPIANRYSFVGRGIALCPVVNSVIVLTDGFPIMFTGSDPEAMSPITIETYAPCVAKRGAVNVGGGMLYPSHDGLWLATASGVINKTRALYRLDEWKALAPETFDAEFHDGQYYAVHTPVGGTKRMLVMDIAELDSSVAVSDSADALYRNNYDGELYAAKGAQILRWDSNDAKRYLTEWTSVQVQLDKPRNFSHAQVHANWSQVAAPDTTILEANQALIAAGPDAVNGFVIGSEFNVFEVNGSNIDLYDPPNERKVQFVLFDGDVPVFSKIVTDSRPFRLPAGYKSEAIRVGINASVTVYSARIAESSAELSAEP